jgi:hypothetical protein
MVLIEVGVLKHPPYSINAMHLSIILEPLETPLENNFTKTLI